MAGAKAATVAKSELLAAGQWSGALRVRLLWLLPVEPVCNPLWPGSRSRPLHKWPSAGARLAATLCIVRWPSCPLVFVGANARCLWSRSRSSGIHSRWPPAAAFQLLISCVKVIKSEYIYKCIHTWSCGANSGADCAGGDSGDSGGAWGSPAWTAMAILNRPVIC